MISSEETKIYRDQLRQALEELMPKQNPGTTRLRIILDEYGVDYDSDEPNITTWKQGEIEFEAVEERAFIPFRNSRNYKQGTLWINAYHVDPEKVRMLLNGGQWRF